MGPTLLPERPVTSLDDYLAQGGARGLEAARRLGPEATLEEVARSGLRGRGGAGFPTGAKWRSVRGGAGERRYLVANGAEGEPGTYKDRAILSFDPYQVIEGLAIGAFAVGAVGAYIAVKERFTNEVQALTRAMSEMAAAGLAGDVPISLVAGPDEYLFGEEKGLLEVIEGNAPLPRVLPPYQHGLFATTPQLGWSAEPAEAADTGQGSANPTAVNNVETLAHVAHILARGASWFRERGTATSPGTMVFTVSGDVARPGVYELEMGTPLRALVEDLGGGMAGGRPVKAVISGVANQVLTAAQLGTPMDFDSMTAAGSGLGSGGFVVYDDTTCALALARTCSRFLYVESCGQCPACKLGTGDMTAALERLEAFEGTDRDVGVIEERLLKVADGNRCYLPIEEIRLVDSLLRAFPDDVAAHLDRSCGLRHGLPVPKIVGFDDTTARFVLDSAQARKQPDWTYA